MSALWSTLILAGVWCLLLERAWLGIVFVWQDLRFLLVQRRAIRGRIAELIETHGACTGRPEPPA